MESLGIMRWGIKRSLRDYVEGLPDGDITVSRGTARGTDGEFVLPLVTAGEGVYASDGVVTMSGHHDALHVTLEGLTVTVDGDTATVTVRSGTGELRIARARVADRQEDGFTLEPTVTTMGSQLLGGVYAVGTDLDPLEVTVARDAGETT